MTDVMIESLDNKSVCRAASGFARVYKLEGRVTPLMAHPPLLAPPLCIVGWFGKTEIYVLEKQSICLVRQNHPNF